MAPRPAPQSGGRRALGARGPGWHEMADGGGEAIARRLATAERAGPPTPIMGLARDPVYRLITTADWAPHPSFPAGARYWSRP